MPNTIPQMVLEDRKYFIGALKSGDYQQCFDGYFTERNDSCAFCAVGLAMRLTHDDFMSESTAKMTSDIKERYLIDSKQVDEIVWLNDKAKFSFNTIADSLTERGFLKRVDFKPYPH